MPSEQTKSVLGSHDVVQLRPASRAADSIPVGNGRMMLMVHTPGHEMVWQVNHSDYWRYCPVDEQDHPHYGARPVGLGRLRFGCEDGLIVRPAQYEQRLCLADGRCRLKVQQEQKKIDAELFCDMDEDLAVLRYRHEADAPTVMTVSLEGWREGVRAEERDGMLVLHEPAGPARSPDEAAYLRKLTGEQYEPPVHQMAMAAAVVGGEARVVFVEPNHAMLKITVPANTELTVYLAAEVIEGDGNAIEGACRRAHAAATAVASDLDQRSRRHAAWWEEFWGKSYVRIESVDAAAGYAENVWYLHRYHMATTSRGKHPAKFNGATWLYDGDRRLWGGGHWHFNSRSAQQAMFAANHPELARRYFDVLSENLELIRRQTMEIWGHGGAFVHETHGPDALAYQKNRESIYSGKTEYCGLIFSTGLEIAYQMVRYAQVLGDERYLRESVYPYLKETADFYRFHLRREQDGKWHLFPANAHETFWRVKDPQPDLAAIRACYPILIELSERFGLDEELREAWREVLANLADYPRGKFLTEGPKYRPTITGVDQENDVYASCTFMGDRGVHNKHPVDVWTSWPFEMSCPGSEDYDLAVRSFRERFFPQVTSTLAPDMLPAAVLGLGHEARQLLESYLWQNPVLGGGVPSHFGNVYHARMVHAEEESVEPCMEFTGDAALAVNVMLLQDHRGLLRITPAWPADWDADFRLRAAGPVMVEGSVRTGRVVRLRIEAMKDQAVALRSPWDAGLQVRHGTDIVARGSGVVKWDAGKGQVFEIAAADGTEVKLAEWPARQTRKRPRRWRQRVLGLDV